MLWLYNKITSPSINDSHKNNLREILMLMKKACLMAYEINFENQC